MINDFLRCEWVEMGKGVNTVTFNDAAEFRDPFHKVIMSSQSKSHQIHVALNWKLIIL